MVAPQIGFVFKAAAIAVIAFVCNTALLAQPSSYGRAPKVAQGMVIYRGSGSYKAPTYDGALFTTANPVAAWVEYDVGQVQPLRLEAGQVVRVIDFESILDSEFTTENHLAANQRVQSLVLEAAKDSPKLVAITKAVSEAIQNQINQYRNGMVRHRGQWMDSNDFAKLIKQRGDEEQDITQRRITLRSAFKAEVVKPLLADFDVFNHSASIQSSIKLPGTSTNLGTLDPGLRGRSKMLPGSYSLKIEVGIYPSESSDGPAVLWAARDDNLLALDVGLCIRHGQEDQKLINTTELEQAKFFLSKFDDKLFETIPDVLVAAKIKSVLNPAEIRQDYVTLQKEFFDATGARPTRESVVLIGRLTTQKGDFTMLQKETARYRAIFLVGKPATLNDGSVRQMVIVMLR
jgi:hypothetical protein